MFFFNKIKDLFKTKADTDNSVIYNPIINSSSDNFDIISQYLRSHNLSLNELLEWTCPICYEPVSSETPITIPFKCHHPVCFSCLRNCCHTISLRFPGQSCKHIKCSLCRKPPNFFWIKSYHTYSVSITYQNRIIKIILPSDLHSQSSDT